MMVLSFYWSCKTDKIEEKEPDPTPTYLSGTKWKLEGLINTETGAFTALEPIDCEECYTLTFITDYKAYYRAIVDYTTLVPESEWPSIDLLNLNPSKVLIDFRLITQPYKGENYDITPFYWAIKLTESFTVTSEELKLYNYRSPQYRRCLLFKQFKTIEL